jgi:protein-S-isoprenylcysteine O-methyltransferase Ste14
MGFLEYLTIASIAAWTVSEVAIGLFSLINRLSGPSEGEDHFSFVVIWFAIGLPVWFAVMAWRHLILPNGFGSFAALSPLLGYLGCLAFSLGIAIRLVAVATLKKQFTTTVAIVEKHEIVDTGLYRTIRHPAYLGLLLSLLGFGLVSGNWLSLAAAVVLPLAAILYRIQVEEQALLRHFGSAYQAYASRTQRLLPGIY